MKPARPFLVFVLGSFRDVTPGGSASKGVLERLVAGLRQIGWDAFLSGDERSRELAKGSFRARKMTEILEPLCDLAVYVALPEGREGGWVAEIVAMQLQHPEGATKRVLMLKKGLELSSMLKPSEEGYMADPPVAIVPWRDEAEMLERADAIARHVAVFGRVPARD